MVKDLFIYLKSRFLFAFLVTFIFPFQAFGLDISRSDQLAMAAFDSSSRVYDKVRKKTVRYRGGTHKERNAHYLVEHFTTTHGLKVKKKKIIEGRQNYGFLSGLVANATKPERNPVAFNLIQDFLEVVTGKTHVVTQRSSGNIPLNMYTNDGEIEKVGLPYRLTIQGDFQGFFDPDLHSDLLIRKKMEKKLQQVISGDKGVSIGVAYSNEDEMLQPTTTAVLIFYISQDFKDQIDAWKDDPQYVFDIGIGDALPISFAPRIRRK